MVDEPVLTADYTWTAGYYELMFDVGEGRPAAERVADVGAALWAHPMLNGPCPRPDLEPDQQVRCAPGTESCFGTAVLPDGRVVACGSRTLSSLRDFAPDGEPHPPDLLEFYVPLGSLARVRPQIGGFPFEQRQHARHWQEPLEDWLAGIAADTYATAHFARAAIDFEFDLDYDLWRSWTRATVPVERAFGLLLPASGELVHLGRTTWV